MLQTPILANAYINSFLNFTQTLHSEDPGFALATHVLDVINSYEMPWHRSNNGLQDMELIEKLMSS